MKKGPVRYSTPISRRMMLRGAGGAVLSLPLFHDLVAPEARAQNAGFPKRLCIIFTPNGTIPETYFGSGDENSLTLGQIMTPLERHKDDIIVLDGLDMQAAIGAYGDAHGVGMGCLLTGKELQQGEQFVAGMGGPGSGWPDNISIDQLIARTVGTTTPLSSLELAGKRFAGNVWSRMSYTGPAEPVAPEDNPQLAFDRVFASVGQDAGELAARDRRRTAVLDNTLEELNTLHARLGVADRAKLELHTTTLQELRSKIGTMGTDTGCTPPERPTVMNSPEVIANASGMEVINANNDITFPDIIDAELDIIAGAFACDITRVASIVVAPSRSDVVMTWDDFNVSHHEVSHWGDAENDSKGKLTQMNQWYSDQIALFVDRLKAIPEGDGTVFDNTVIAWVNELGIGNVHSHTRIPLSIIGSGGGYFRTGRKMTYTGTTHNDLLISLGQAMGLDLTEFGNPAYCKGGLTGLTA